jgi:hypothetical protein
LAKNSKVKQMEAQAFFRLDRASAEKLLKEHLDAVYTGHLGGVHYNNLYVRGMRFWDDFHSGKQGNHQLYLVEHAPCFNSVRKFFQSLMTYTFKELGSTHSIGQTGRLILNPTARVATNAGAWPLDGPVFFAASKKEAANMVLGYLMQSAFCTSIVN